MLAFLPKSLLGTFCSFTSCDSMILLLSFLRVLAEPQGHTHLPACRRVPCSRTCPGKAQALWSQSLSGGGSTLQRAERDGSLSKVPSLPKELSKLMEALSAKWFNERARSWISEITDNCLKKSPESFWSHLEVQWCPVLPSDLSGGRLEVIFHLMPVKPCLPLVSCY